jgi:hypothetical protein
MALQDTAAVQELRDLLSRLMGDEEEFKAFEEGPEEYLSRHGFEDVSSDDIATCMPEQYRMPEAAQSEYVSRAAANASAHASAQAQVVEQIRYHHSYYYDQSTDIFNSIEVGDITADGDVNLDFDQDLNAATGDEAVAIDESYVDGNVNTGDGAINVDGSVDDSSFNTGEFNGIQESGEGDVNANGAAVGEDNLVDNSRNLDVDVTFDNDTTNITDSEDVNVANDDSLVFDNESTDVDVDLNLGRPGVIEPVRQIAEAPEPADDGMDDMGE